MPESQQDTTNSDDSIRETIRVALAEAHAAAGVALEALPGLDLRAIHQAGAPLSRDDLRVTYERRLKKLDAALTWLRGEGALS